MHIVIDAKKYCITLKDADRLRGYRKIYYLKKI